MRRAVGLSRAELEDHEKVFDGLTLKLIRRALRTATSNSILTAAVTLSAEPPPPNPTIPAGALGVVTTTWSQDVDSELFPYLVQTYVDAAAGVYGVAQELAPDTPKITYDMAASYLASAQNRLKGIGDLVWSDMRAQLTIGYQAGESIEQLATRLRKVAAISEPRALTIARTEVIPAANFGSLQQLKAAGFTDEECLKEWLATDDVRTREEHRLADGQKVGINQPFHVGGDFLQVPGDPAGRADNVINCRCSVAYVFSEDDDAETLTSAADVLQLRWIEREHPRDLQGQFTSKFDWLSSEDVLKMHAEMQADGGPWRYAQWSALSKYVGTDYKPINNALRANDTSDSHVSSTTATIRSAMRPTTRDLRVKRAVEVDAFEGITSPDDMVKMVGHTFEEPGFLSTTVNSTLYSDATTKSTVILEIDIPSGTKAAYLGAPDGPGLKRESELLLDTNTQFVVTEVRSDRGQVVVHAKVVKS